MKIKKKINKNKKDAGSPNQVRSVVHRLCFGFSESIVQNYMESFLSFLVASPVSVSDETYYNKVETCHIVMVALNSWR